MKVIRYISRKELKTLLDTGKVNAKYLSGGELRCYYFPIQYTLLSTIKYNIKFSTGVVAKDDGDYYDDYICVCLNKFKKKLSCTKARYADPYGHFFDTIWVNEVYDNGYKLEDVQSFYLVDWYGDELKRISKKRIIEYKI